MKKKTYVFDDSTLDMIDKLKCELNQKEVTILKEAVRLLHEYHCNRKETYDYMKEIVRKLDYIVERIEFLSYQLGQCRERNEQLERKLRELIEDAM